MAVRELSGVTKHHGARSVLRGVDLAVQDGESVGILGSNGSGKSTLLRILAGVSRPSGGTVTGRPRTGYVPDRFPARQRMSARAYLRHLGRIGGLSTAEASARADRWLERFALAGGPGTPLRELSKGNAQKVGLAQALLCEPELLVLDEPWSGLDPDAHTVLTEVIREVSAAGAVVVFTDHRPEVVHALATRSHRLADGRLELLDPARRAGSPITTVGARTGGGRVRAGILAARGDPAGLRGARGGFAGAGGQPMIPLVRYQLAVLGHSQRYLPPVLLYVGLLAIFYSNNDGPALPGFAVTAAGLLILAGWLTIALVDVEDAVQRTVTQTHVGSTTRMLLGTVLAVLLCSVGLALLTVAWAEISYGLGYSPSDLGVRLLAHVVCASFGIAVALPCSGLVVRRIGYTVIAAAALFAIALLAKWVPLAFPLLQALSSGAVSAALLIRSALVAAGILIASTLLVTTWYVRRS
ncbi:ABC transporter ATP-binding protein [Saccharopolyspora sp. ASAGF58]|uniref:ABC transporter ATP-binding protein n=1 Tax=Saccharopolyspora sp. ASAGF58 TaxID=2719023 RepID=UPI001FF0ADEE|nr:ATP-binding cassette domain-containing protein [Saccharopolyspora sp. ASAGF58]